MKHVYSLFAFALLLAFTACQKDEAIEPGIESVEFSAAVYALDDLNRLANPVLTNATETQAFAFTENHEVEEHHTLHYILRQLNLDAAQRTAIRGFAENQATCIADHRATIKERHDELLKRANAIREEQIKAYRAGNITKSQLEERLATLRTRLLEYLQSDELKQVRLRMMLQCRRQLFIDIASVLTQEQRGKFRHWVESLR